MRSFFYKSAVLSAVLCVSTLFTVFGLGGKEGAARGNEKQLAVFIPGVLSGSPIYEMLARGVQDAARDFSKANPKSPAAVTVIEGAVNQAEWEPKITALAASGSYDLIVSSNPSLPAIVQGVSAKFPAQKFLLLDGELSGNPQVYSLRYNQREQAYVAGHIAALVTLEMNVSGEAPKQLGLIAAQEYPVMNTIIRPGFEEGAKAVDSDFSVEFRVVGNWFDAVKSAEIASELLRGGAQVLLSIAGSANDGVLRSAAIAGKKVVWFDTNGYAILPGTVIGSAVLRQDKASYEKTLLFLNGTLPFGKAEIVGIADGYVDFITDDPLYEQAVSEAVREKQLQLLNAFRSGSLRLKNDDTDH
ncbi:BMP family ABC transporter substrate-binding protein [Breznakiellaceae bacterium SP9]